MESSNTKKINIKKLIIDILIVVLCIGSMIGVFAYIKNRNKSNDFNEDDVKGSIVFKLYDENDSLVINDELEFSEGESIYNILNRNYTLKIIESAGIGKAIIEVNEYKTNWTDNYFAFYVDGGYSNYGVEGVKAKDKMEIKFVWTKLN